MAAGRRLAELHLDGEQDFWDNVLWTEKTRDEMLDHEVQNQDGQTEPWMDRTRMDRQKHGWTEPWLDGTMLERTIDGQNQDGQIHKGTMDEQNQDGQIHDWTEPRRNHG